MSTQYHISPTDSRPRPCDATKKACPLGAVHISEAQYQNYLNGEFASVDDVFIQANTAKPKARSRGVRVSDVDYNAWPVPQANDLDKVGAVVDSIAYEATTAEAIGEAVGVGDRNGSYYANAAGYLGLVDKLNDGDGVTHFALTPAGELYAAASPTERMAFISELVERTPLAQAARDGFTMEDIRTEITESGAGYSESVAKRRATTLNTWLNTLDKERDSLTANIDQQQRETIFRSVEAAMKQRAAAEARRVVVAEVRRGEMCMNCFTEKSLAGECLC